MGPIIRPITNKIHFMSLMTLKTMTDILFGQDESLSYTRLRTFESSNLDINEELNKRSF